jgi:hypothetical protein
MTKPNLLQKTKSELLKIAKRLGLRGVSTLNKPDLAQRIRQAQTRPAQPASAAETVAREAAAGLKRRARRKQPDVATTVKRSSRRESPLQVQLPASELVASTARKAETEALRASAGELAAHKFELGPTPPPAPLSAEELTGALPESYGTGRLFLTARDPHWLYAYWDFSAQQMAGYRRKSADGRLLLRVFEQGRTEPVQELALQPESRDWHIPVNKAATAYRAELGYRRKDGRFHAVSKSREATTPPEAMSPQTAARFVAIPVDLRFRDMLELIREHLREGEELAESLYRLEREGFQLPFQVRVELGPWSAQQAAELERALGGEMLRRVQVGSFETSEWLQRRLQEQLGSAVFSALQPAGASWFSPAGASWQRGEARKGFWFAVNAELIIYGATEPDATVTVDGQPIKLRSDGTFSFHYSFPDGQYRLPVVAISADQSDRRAVELGFERRTHKQGEVGDVRQPEHLQAPATGS